MSMQCVCDRCGAVIEDCRGVSFEIRSRADKTNVLSHGDLCPDCECEIEDFLLPITRESLAEAMRREGNDFD